ncbi:MAG: aquaporin [Phenylobacterium sp.]|uniref:aquaporin n=1 Tax=Phenylobacterium sp. TaxID=1871053 RepID=UPI0025FB6B33|nr:aquaporin [Phenylobacterium sp.]MCA3725502.1 aquaporin [Phenylobacterium sp.]MCA3731786.1 aquaporin [Phenylobacterium sp.]MCA6242323.1 aquaporin [Phenylobacterium sp.]MCA6260520.1 aquaporin [Phenylobacterium sp.]MCA6277168.1 aquaporin [Phenylobacterium sp.]
MTSAAPGFGLARRLAAEGLGTALLLSIVVGSGIMGERLSGGNDAIALMLNTVSTGAGLAVLITLLGPISGAHFNPLVSVLSAGDRDLAAREALARVAVQVVAAVAGVFLAHAMFELPLFQVSDKVRSGGGQVLSEAVATFGLILVIRLASRLDPGATPALVALYITAAYGFTASTSFANPAVTLARSLTDTFAGIAPESVPGFLLGQVGGALAAAVASRWLLDTPRPHS